MLTIAAGIILGVIGLFFILIVGSFVIGSFIDWLNSAPEDLWRWITEYKTGITVFGIKLR